MVVAARLAWVKQELSRGRQARIKMSSFLGKVKLTLVLLPQRHAGMMNLPAIAMIDLFLERLHGVIAVDHGHANSAGESHISICMMPAPLVASVAAQGVAEEIAKDASVGDGADMDDCGVSGDCESVEPEVPEVPEEIKELDDVEEVLYLKMMAAEETLQSLSDVYEGMKADPTKFDPTSFTLNLATAHEAVVTANHCAKEATSEWQKADSELKAASHRAAKAADARSRKEIKKDGVDMCDD